MSVPRNNHYIPQVYLRNFAHNQGKKFFFKVFNKQHNSEFIKNVKDVCVVKDFYNWVDYDGTVRTDIEKRYGIVESGMPQAYRMIHSNKTEITLDEKFHLLHSFHSLAYRNTNTSDILQEMFLEFDKLTSTVTEDAKLIPVTIRDGHGNEYRSPAQSMSEFVRVGKARFKQTLLEHRMKDCIDVTLKKMDRIIDIVKIAPNPCLFSSDTPLSSYPLLRNDKKIEDVLLFPVDSFHAIVFSKPNPKDHPLHLYRNRITLDPKIINQLQYQYAMQIIYGLPEVVDLFLADLKSQNHNQDSQGPSLAPASA